MAAAVAAAQNGLRVELFEQRKSLGGRARSFLDPKTGQLVDHCQHVSMGCCTALADFCRQTKVDDCFRNYRELHFFGPDGQQCDFNIAGWLPAPLHLLPGLMRLKYFARGERWNIARTLRKLARAQPNDNQESIGAWLQRHGQSEQMIELFWSVVLKSALSESTDRVSLAAAQKVFVDGFLASPHGCELEVPRFPLREIFDRRVGTWLQEYGVAVHRGTRIKQIDGDAARATALVLPDGTRREFDFVVAAVPWQHIRSLLSEAVLEAIPTLQHVDNFQSSPITAVHFWFDRPITPLPHAVLVGKRSQWVFNRGQHYCQVVISAANELVGQDRGKLVAAVRDELNAIWPKVESARLLHWRVITHRSPIFSVTPGVDSYRPSQQTPIENLLLAGDWTSTGWPATMESAVRSGQLAVEGILQALGEIRQLVTPELQPSLSARMILRI